jgi:nitrogen-specific signal transduction histidine kinase
MSAQHPDDEWVFFCRVLKPLADELQKMSGGIRSGKNLLVEAVSQAEFHRFLQEIISQTQEVHERLNVALNEWNERRQQNQEANSITSLIPSLVNDIRSHVLMIGGYADLLLEEESQRGRHEMGQALIHKTNQLQEFVDNLQTFVNSGGSPTAGPPWAD